VSGIHACLAVFVTSQTGEHGKIGGIGVTLGTSSPLSTVISTVNGEILAIMVESRRRPNGCVVAGLARGGKLGCGVRRVRRGVIITQVAGYASR
jgi:hypothetical protein